MGINFLNQFNLVKYFQGDLFHNFLRSNFYRLPSSSFSCSWRQVRKEDHLQLLHTDREQQKKNRLDPDFQRPSEPCFTKVFPRFIFVNKNVQKSFSLIFAKWLYCNFWQKRLLSFRSYLTISINDFFWKVIYTKISKSARQ